jgi:Asp-tRNA(Asn)/Glu-tRNA(Gln) amidotransferase A subunit family amidase
VSSQQNAPSDGVWEGDACSLVEAFRAGSITPPEALEMSLQAIEHSDLNAFCHIDAEGAHLAASAADIELPFGGIPIGVKELDPVAGWPYSEASLVFADRIGDHTSTMVERLSDSGRLVRGDRGGCCRRPRDPRHGR